MPRATGLRQRKCRLLCACTHASHASVQYSPGNPCPVPQACGSANTDCYVRARMHRMHLCSIVLENHGQSRKPEIAQLQAYVAAKGASMQNGLLE
eukprot:204427-Pelagomonas_calceolata.AAC.1